MTACKGFSLVEFLTAIVLSAALMLALIKLVFYFKSTEQNQQAWAKLNQEGYYLSSYLLPRLATVGDFHCDPLHRPSHFIEGYAVGHYPHYLTQKDKVQGEVLVLTRCENQDGSFQFKQRAYYVALTDRRNAKGQFISALYEKLSDGNRLELEEGIQAMRVDYVLYSDVKSHGFYSADQVADWTQVVALNLHFVLSSESASSLSIHKPWDVYVSLRPR